MNYYYLISTLPELHIDDTSLSQEQLEDLIETIRSNLTDEDQAIQQCLLHASDNQNLLYILFHEYHSFEIQSFSRPASIPVEVLLNYRREYAALPDYMIHYLNDLSASFSTLSLSEMEQVLNQYFHAYILNKNSQFLNTYYLWRIRLKQTVAEHNLKSHPFLQIQNGATEPSFPNTRTLHDLDSFDEISNQLIPLIEANDLEAIEQRVNAAYWQFADCWQKPFSSEQAFAYMIKLIRLHRWKGFMSRGDLAREKFENLISDMKLKESSPKMPLL